MRYLLFRSESLQLVEQPLLDPPPMSRCGPWNQTYLGSPARVSVRRLTGGCERPPRCRPPMSHVILGTRRTWGIEYKYRCVDWTEGTRVRLKVALSLSFETEKGIPPDVEGRETLGCSPSRVGHEYRSTGGRPFWPVSVESLGVL